MENAQCCACRKRWQLAILANIGFMIVFGIRCNFGAAKNHMFKNYTDPWGRHHVHDFNWTRAELSVMESSFFYGYLVTQIPAGFLAAKYPPNKLFGIAIGVASFLNILLPYGFKSKSDTLVALIQILQGLVQGVAYPSMHGVWRYWAPPLERSKLATTAFTGSYAGAVLGLPVSAFLVSYVGWSAPFYLYGFAGVVWSVFWFSLTFEKPAFHPTITQDEKKYIEDAIGHVSATHPSFHNIPWKAIVTSKPVWAIIVANFARSWTFYLLLQNQLTYMKEALDMNISDSGMLAALPHAVMGIVVLFGGQLADYLRSNKILSTTAVRKIFNCGGFGGEAAFMLVVAYTKKESTAVLALVLAVGCSGFAISGFNVNHLDIAPRYAAILMGFSNGIGTLAGLTCPIVTEKFTENGPQGWVKVFLLASLIHFTGITFYAIYASGELQEWAEPKPEEEAWNVTALNQRSSNAGYGAAKNEMPISLAPLPTAEQLHKASLQTDYMDQYLQYAVIENKVLFVDSNVSVSLIASNSLLGAGGEDKFVVLPICQLGMEYHVVGDESSHVFQSYQSTNIITIIATQDSTTQLQQFVSVRKWIRSQREGGDILSQTNRSRWSRQSLADGQPREV
ncbi:transporter, major facilitator family protein [Teladorsagia circumcincta]|uniref:Transporter, major facilitator family protein n=1 Tax=Teladorsagia circumcincta TaxID=45464 RepID=A0A2G9UJ93_TELCI|nr:transporter, major facilitator family protein [Teladorsagia circumcincta]